MCGKMIKKGRLFFVLPIILILISGCETIGAIGAGELKMRDISRMTNLETTTGETPDTENTLLRKIKQVDTWIRQNLW